ncbi:hypothetical protein CAL29_07415 [Bordetella genomosp. 10]|uniref:HTH lysR-type domain-containing protein n=1 Tax=Bordetella genomosp. 10 TaxID=1416804 RepID=A0A261SME5_9BORD|nr:LysR family transcriptional regulator [Bordetella genomosp. 10]OZI38157.1 hypothetical protein CAL29_07415 [Bordetella genomosp. 10]
MKLQYLATLSAVVARGNLTAAAEQVNLTRSAVSLQMKQLEAWFGQPLFDRSGRNVKPTAFAREVVRTVDRSMAELEALRRHTDSAPAGRVRLGITDSAQTTLLPLAFTDLLRRAPKVELHIERGSTPLLLDALKAGRIDVAVLIRPPTGGSRRLLWTELLDEEMVLVVPRSLRPAPPAQILREQPWIRFDRELVAGRMAAQYVEKRVPHCHALVEIAGIDAIVALVGAGVGVSVLPRLRPEHLQAHAVREIALGPDAPIRRMAMVRRKADGDHRLLDLVESAFQEAAGKLRNGAGRAW